MQYPRNMGKPGAAAEGKTLALTVGADGGIGYDGIVKQGANRGRDVHSKFTDLMTSMHFSSEASGAARRRLSRSDPAKTGASCST